MSEWPMRGRFRYLRFKTFPTTPRTPQCEVFFPLLSSSEHSGVPEDSNSQLFPSVGFHPHTWPKWGCDIYAPEGRLRDVLLKECHDGPLTGHGGAKCTTTFLKKSYYWPNLKDDAEEYVKICLTCQQNWTFNKKQAGLLRPTPLKLKLIQFWHKSNGGFVRNN